MPEENKQEVIYVLNDLMEDFAIPRNVREILKQIHVLLSKEDSGDVELANIEYKLQDISEDVNLPLNAKSDIWLLLSKIEKLKKNSK
jgi:uncharacterized protein